MVGVAAHAEQFRAGGNLLELVVKTVVKLTACYLYLNVLDGIFLMKQKIKAPGKGRNGNARMRQHNVLPGI